MSGMWQTFRMHVCILVWTRAGLVVLTFGPVNPLENSWKLWLLLSKSYKCINNFTICFSFGMFTEPSGVLQVPGWKALD